MEGDQADAPPRRGWARGRVLHSAGPELRENRQASDGAASRSGPSDPVGRRSGRPGRAGRWEGRGLAARSAAVRPARGWRGRVPRGQPGSRGSSLVLGWARTGHGECRSLGTPNPMSRQPGRAPQRHVGADRPALRHHLSRSEGSRAVASWHACSSRARYFAACPGTCAP